MGKGRGNKGISLLLAALILILAASLGGCGSKKQAGATAVPPVAVELAQVKRGSIAQMVRVTGIVRAGTTVQVMAAATGKVKAVYVNVGDKVSQGQVIAELDNAVQAASLEQAQATLEQAQLGLEQAGAALKQAEAQAAMDAANLQRIQTLFDQGPLRGSSWTPLTWQPPSAGRIWPPPALPWRPPAPGLPPPRRGCARPRQPWIIHM